MICQHCCTEFTPNNWGIAAELTATQSCLTCYFWQDYITHLNNRSVVVDGKAYVIGAELSADTPRQWAGFGGHEFTIQFFDGREVVTRNLNAAGVVPDYWRSQLPDNAKFKQSEPLKAEAVSA